MGDQGKWWKLWLSSLDDDDLENLSIHEWFAWVRFGAHIKMHGKNGKIRLRSPAKRVANLMRVSGFKEVIEMIKKFPNYVIEGAHEGLKRGAKEGSKNVLDVTVDEEMTFSIKCKNWHKFQGDWSRDRVRKHRKAVTTNVTVQEEKRREVEEKRSNTTTKKYLAPTSDNGKIVMAYKNILGISAEDEAWDKQFWPRWSKQSKIILEQIGGLHDAISFLEHWSKQFTEQGMHWNLRTIADKAVSWAAKQRGKTSHDNANHRTGISSAYAHAKPNPGGDAIREDVPPGQIFAALRNSDPSQDKAGPDNSGV